MIGPSVGEAVRLDVVGVSVGEAVGVDVVGTSVGKTVAVGDGASVGVSVGEGVAVLQHQYEIALNTALVHTASSHQQLKPSSRIQNHDGHQI